MNNARIWKFLIKKKQFTNSDQLGHLLPLLAYV